MKVFMFRVEAVLRVLAAIVALIVIMALKSANAQTWVEQRTFVSGGQAAPRIDGLVSQTIKGKFGGFVWFQTEKNYSQAYGGITYSPKLWIQLAAGPGIEQDKKPLRVGGFVWLGSGKDSLLFIPEYGGSGFWWKLETNRKVNKSIGLGLLTERYKGTGPRVEYKIPKTKATVWVAPMFERHRANALIGIRWSL